MSSEKGSRTPSPFYPKLLSRHQLKSWTSPFRIRIWRSGYYFCHLGSLQRFFWQNGFSFFRIRIGIQSTTTLHKPCYSSSISSIHHPKYSSSPSTYKVWSTHRSNSLNRHWSSFINPAPKQDSLWVLETPYSAIPSRKQWSFPNKTHQ